MSKSLEILPMRAFIAVSLPEKTKNRLEKIQKRLRQSGIRATWVKRDKIHLTLIFFGSINQRQAKQVGRILKNKIQQAEPIKLKLGDLNAFPNLDFPRVLKLDLEGEIKKLETINLKLRRVLENEKIPFDPKLFISHLTLGRLRRMKPRQRKQTSLLLKETKLKEKPQFEINQISLIKSKLTPKGPIYTILKKINLSKKIISNVKI